MGRPIQEVKVFGVQDRRSTSWVVALCPSRDLTEEGADGGLGSGRGDDDDDVAC